MPECICMTEPNIFQPCPVPEEGHEFEPIEVYYGPDEKDRYKYIKNWWDAGRHRLRGQVFFGELKGEINGETEIRA